MPLLHGLNDNELHFHTFSLSDRNALAASGDTLSNDEQERAAKFVFDRDRDRYRIGRVHLRKLLAEYTGILPEKISFHYNAFGKPSIDGRIKFNLSHSENLMAVVVAGGCEVGVDIELLRTLDDIDGMARIAFTKEEQEWLAVQPEKIRTESFFRLWTRKEALLKAAGVGFGDNSQSVLMTTPVNPFQQQVCGFRDAFWVCIPILPISGFAASLCHEGGAGAETFLHLYEMGKSLCENEMMPTE